MIRIVTEYNEILHILDRYMNRFKSFGSGVIRKEEIAFKLSSFGTTIELVENNYSVGFAAFYHNDYISLTAYISLLAVAENQEGKKYGTRLLEEVERICLDSRMKTIRLEVHKDNTRAIRFYQKNGYTMNANTDTSFFMSKNIKTSRRGMHK